MDIKQLKFSMKLAETRAKSDPSESNLAILKTASDAYEFALDPEKKTEDAGHQPEPVVPKSAAAPKPAAPKPSPQKPVAAPKVETTQVAAQPTLSEPSTPQSQEQQPTPQTATIATSDQT